jgi:Zn-dependent M28 family amino/carboxypeptidase
VEALVCELCSEDCNGRRTGTPGGLRAREIVRDAFRHAGLDPGEQRIGATPGANLVAKIPGDVDRWVLVAAHYDHLGPARPGFEGHYYAGADDNAAAVAIMIEVARALATNRAPGRGVILAAFDAEEPPFYLTEAMGSDWWTRHPDVPLDRIDLMVCLDLVGHRVGPASLPREVGDTLFAVGAERSAGTSAVIDAIAREERGVVVRRADAEILDPLSDYAPFWRREVPFVFLTNARNARYHTLLDTADALDWTKMRATARWVERLVRATCARPDDRVAFLAHARDDVSSLDTIAALARHADPGAEEKAKALLAECDRSGALPGALARRPLELVAALERALAG